MKNFCKSACLLSLLISSQVFADTSAPCGTPGEYVDVGDTLQQMLDKCGQPTSSSEQEVPGPLQGQKVRWYYVLNLMLSNPGDVPLYMSQEARYIVEFVDGKVNLIYAADETLDSYTSCGMLPQDRGQVKRGMTMDQVKETCGAPSFTDVIDSGTDAPAETITHYTYQFDPTVPPVIATVSEGVVTSIQQ
jgi:hypothetical protein